MFFNSSLIDWKDSQKEKGDRFLLWAFSMPSSWRNAWLLALGLWSVYAVGLMTPGVIYTNMMAHDNYIFIDGIYRVLIGDIPNLDFISGLGPLNFMGPAALAFLSDSPYTLFLMFNLLVLFLCLSVGVYLSQTRLPRLPGICFQLYLAAVIAAPVPMGFSGSNVTFAMYYNRIGWGGLMLLALLFLSTPDPGRWTHKIEGFFVGIALAFLLYTKITYFLIAVVLFIFFAVYRKLHRTSLLYSLGVLLVVGTVIELAYPGLNRSYLGDILDMAMVGNDFFGRLRQTFKLNIISILIPLALLIILMPTLSFKMKNSGKKVLSFYFLLLGSSLFILSTNAEVISLPLMFSVILIATALFSQSVANSESDRPSHRAVAILLILGLLPWVSETIERQGAMERFFRIGRSGNYEMKVPDQMKKMFIDEGVLGGLDRADVDGNIQVSFTEFRSLVKNSSRQEIFQTQYAYTVARGVKAMREVFNNYGPGSLYNLDFANPFSHLLRAPTAKGTYLWHHDTRNFSLEHYRPAQEIFANVDYVMIPRLPMVEKTSHSLKMIYGNYIKANYSCVLRTELWGMWLKKQLLPPNWISLYQNVTDVVGVPGKSYHDQVLEIKRNYQMRKN